MKKVSVSNMLVLSRKAAPYAVVALGLVAVVASQGGPASSKAALTEIAATGDQAQTSEIPAPTASPEVVLNGQPVKVDGNGSAEVDMPGGKAHVQVTDGHMSISTNSNKAAGDTSNQNKTGNVSVKLDSQSNGGTNWSNTQIYGYNNSSDNTSTGYSSTQIFSTGSDHVSVSQQ